MFKNLKLFGNNKEKKPEQSTKIAVINKFKCGYCGACVGVCPVKPAGALELIETWIEVDKTCIGCGVCAKICPVGAITIENKTA